MLLYTYIKVKDILIEILDSGVGISEALINTINSDLKQKDNKSKNMGLRNVNECIQLNFGENYGIKVGKHPW